MDEKNSFILYRNYRKQFSLLSDEQAGRLIKAIFAYCDGEEPQIEDLAVTLVYSLIRDQIARDTQKYEEIKQKRKEAGSRGGKAKAANVANIANASFAKQNVANASKNKQTLANLAVNVNENVNGNVNENENDNVNENESENNKTSKPTRHRYGEYQNVLLSDDELAKVQAEFPADWEKRIERLSEYMASTGKSYKSHLATIRAWARKDNNQQAQQQQEDRYAKWERMQDYVQKQDPTVKRIPIPRPDASLQERVNYENRVEFLYDQALKTQKREEKQNGL